jgi:hypothetical protein
VREEAYNYRIVGTLPAGWKRDEDRLRFVYAIDGIPHAYVQFQRERLRGELDVREELVKRATYYRFAGAPKEATETIERVQWAGRDAYRYEHEAKIQGVVCRRVVRALFDGGIWYECIETQHGEPDAAARAGLACFRGGFRLLVEPVPAAEKDDPAERAYADGVYGYRLVKPKGFVRVAVNPGADAGCRLAFERRGPLPTEHLVVRLFEYGVRRTYDPAHWIELFANAFGREHAGAKKEAWSAPAARGAARTDGIRLAGTRDGKPVVTTIALWQDRAGRVFGLRITAHGGAESTHAAALKALLDSIELTGR